MIWTSSISSPNTHSSYIFPLHFRKTLLTAHSVTPQFSHHPLAQRAMRSEDLLRTTQKHTYNDIPSSHISFNSTYCFIFTFFSSVRFLSLFAFIWYVSNNPRKVVFLSSFSSLAFFPHFSPSPHFFPLPSSSCCVVHTEESNRGEQQRWKKKKEWEANRIAFVCKDMKRRSEEFS